MRERTCIVTRETRDEAEMIRFVTDPNGCLVPDFAARLPGRGLWVTAQRDIIVKAVEKNLFSRAAKQRVEIQPADPAAFCDRLIELLTARLLDGLGLAKRAGNLAHGRFRVEERIKHGPIGLLVEASDGADDGRHKLRAKARTAAGLKVGADVPRLDSLTCTQLSLALGAENVVHAALDPGALAKRLGVDAARLTGLQEAIRPDVAAVSQVASGS